MHNNRKNAKHAKIAHAQYKIWQNIKYAKMQNRCKKKKKCAKRNMQDKQKMLKSKDNAK